MPECPFCQIIEGRIPAYKVFEADDVLAFLDINPRNPGHTLVVPKKHAESLFDLSEDEAGKLFSAVRKVAELVKNGTKADGISISLSSGRAAGQVIPHLHFHVIPRFLNEGPAGLESMLPVKPINKEALEKLADLIRKGEEKEEIGFSEEF